MLNKLKRAALARIRRMTRQPLQATSSDASARAGTHPDEPAHRRSGESPGQKGRRSVVGTKIGEAGGFVSANIHPVFLVL